MRFKAVDLIRVKMGTTREGLLSVDSNECNRWLNKIHPMQKLNGLYSAYYIGRLNRLNDIQPIIVLIEADDYEAIHLLLLKGDEVTDNYEIAAGLIYDYQNELWNELWKDYKFSEFKSDTILIVFENKLKGKESDSTVTIIDSIRVELRISDNGKLKLESRDSIRIIKKGVVDK